MSIWGKIIGGATGFALGGPIGALVGVAAGHFVDRASTRRRFALGSSRGVTWGSTGILPARLQ